MKKAQATLEFTLAFVIIIALMFSLLIMWKWSTNNIVRRQVWYQGTRVQAGSGSSLTTAGSLVLPPTPQKLKDSDMAYPENK